MPPRFAYWTIIAGGLPTAFRAVDREELLPTFTRLKEKQPDAEMKWFARGKLWSSPEEARGQRERDVSGGDRNRDRGSRPPRPDERRDRDWRPGGDHRDPRQQFTDAKRARNQRFKAEKFARKSHRDEPPRARPHGDPLAPDRRTRHDGSRQGRSKNDRKEWPREPRPETQGAWKNREPNNREAKNRRPRDDRSRPLADWNAKPPREKPHGDQLMRPPRSRDDGERRNEGRPKSFHSREEPHWKQKPRGGGRGTFRGQGHGDNSWKGRPPRNERGTEPDTRGTESQNRRPFAPRGFQRDRTRGSGNANPPSQPPRRPNREPRPSENPEPSAPPRPSEPVIAPPGPPERGRPPRHKRHR